MAACPSGMTFFRYLVGSALYHSVPFALAIASGAGFFDEAPLTIPDAGWRKTIRLDTEGAFLIVSTPPSLLTTHSCP